MTTFLQSFEKALDSIRGYPLPKTETDIKVERLEQRADDLRRVRDSKIALCDSIKARAESRVNRLEAEIGNLDDEICALEDQQWELRGVA